MHTVSRFSLASLKHPIVQAPLAGGPSTPALAAAVGRPAGWASSAPATSRSTRSARTSPRCARLDRPAVRRQPVRAARAAGRRSRGRAVRAELSGESAALRDRPRRAAPRRRRLAGEAAADAELAVPVVSFTFGGPARGDSRDLQAAGCAVWITVTTPEEATRAAEAGRGRARGAGRRGRRPPRRRSTTPRPATSGCSRCCSWSAPRPSSRSSRPAGSRPAAPSPPCSPPARPPPRSGPRSCSAPRPAPRPPTAQRSPRPATDRPHARVHRPHRPRDRQPLPARARRRRPERLSRRPPPHGEDPRRRPQPGRPGRLPPVGGAGPRARRAAPGGRARAPARRRGPHRAPHRR